MGQVRPKVIIIRHAEKPGIECEPPTGFDELGRIDPHSLTIHGWQRAGALSSLFRYPRAGSAIEIPKIIYAAKRIYEGDANEHVKVDDGQTLNTTEHLGARAFQTVLPLAQKLRLCENVETYGLGQEANLASDIRTGKCGPGPIVISWEHKRITDIVSGLEPGTSHIKWDGRRFDMLWIFTHDESRYRLVSECQELLERDISRDEGEDANRALELSFNSEQSQTA